MGILPQEFPVIMIVFLALKYGTVDAAIIALPFDVPNIVTCPLYDEPFQVVVPRGNRQSISVEVS